MITSSFNPTIDLPFVLHDFGRHINHAQLRTTREKIGVPRGVLVYSHVILLGPQTTMDPCGPLWIPLLLAGCWTSRPVRSSLRPRCWWTEEPPWRANDHFWAARTSHRSVRLKKSLADPLKCWSKPPKLLTLQLRMEEVAFGTNWQYFQNISKEMFLGVNFCTFSGSVFSTVVAKCGVLLSWSLRGHLVCF